MTEAKQATPHSQLIDELMDSGVPKTEREHAAAREIEWLRAVISDAERRTDVQQEMEQEPVAYITGYYNGRPVVKPVDSSRLLPTGMALYGTPKEGDKLSLPRRAIVRAAAEIGREME
jgi:hypothetical protein